MWKFVIVWLAALVTTVVMAAQPDGSMQEFLAGENRYSLLEKIAPEESKRLRAQIEKEYVERYQLLKQIADAPAVTAAPGSPVAAGGAEGESCTTSETPEHARRKGGDACDDGRNG